MKIKISMVSAIVAILFLSISYADQPVEPNISSNVTVMHGGTADQCPSSWMGNPGSANITADTSEGVSTGSVASGVRSCSDCSLDQSSGDCVCKTCYDNYD